MKTCSSYLKKELNRDVLLDLYIYNFCL